MKQPGADAIEVLVISGSMGAGKTTVLAEASDILATSNVPHAAIDIDALGIVHLPDARSEDLVDRNLAAVWANYAAAGIRRVLIAEAVESPERLERLRRAIPSAVITICRLRASVETMQRRVRTREPGMLQDQLVARAAELERLLDAARIEDFALDNDGRGVTDVARELLVRARWISTQVSSVGSLGAPRETV